MDLLGVQELRGLAFRVAGLEAISTDPLVRDPEVGAASAARPSDQSPRCLALIWGLG